MYVGFVLFVIGVLLIAVRKPLRQRARARWTTDDFAKLRMQQIDQVGKIRQRFAQRIEHRRSELGDLKRRRLELELRKRRLDNFLDDARHGYMAIRALPGKGSIFMCRVHNKNVVDAVGRGLQLSTFDGSWARPQVVFVRAGDPETAKAAVLGAFPEHNGFEILSTAQADDHPATGIYRFGERFLNQIANSRPDEGRSPGGRL